MEKTEKLEKELLTKSPSKFREQIKQAIEYATVHFTNEKRYSQEPSINHALRTGISVVSRGFDTSTIISAILHSFAERKDNHLEIEKLFGEDILNVISETKHLEIPTNNLETENGIITKYILNSSKDLRPVIIRLASILDNINTAGYLPQDQQKLSLRKALYIFAPIAEYLNLEDIKKELEESAFRLYKPTEYKIIETKYQDFHIDENLLESYVKFLQENISDLSIRTYGRIKSIYSVYEKLKKYEREWKDPNITSLKDLLAFRVICKDEKTCFLTLEKLIDCGEINDEEFEDYISNPKHNGYKAIHLTVKFPNISSSLEVEVQILTEDMLYNNTYGPASHIAYKASKSRYANPTDKYNWIEDIHTTLKKHIDGRHITKCSPIPCNIFENEIFVFTPKGQIIPLVKGDTALDFAYRVHSQIGNSAIGAKINGKAGRLDQELKTDDIVEIKTQKGKEYQDIRMLQYVKSQSSKNKITRTILKSKKK